MTGIQEIFEISGTRGVRARVTVAEQYDALANTSGLTVSVDVASDNYGGHIYYLTGALAVEGQTLQSMSAQAGSHFVYTQTKGAFYPVQAGDEDHTGSPWDLADIPHETDGSKTVTVSLNLTGLEEHGRGASGWTLTGSKVVALTHIPRASTLAATDAAIGAVSMVAVSRKSADYGHSIAYRFGTAQGYLTPAGLSSREQIFADTSLPFVLPEDFYGQIPDSRTGLCTLTCRTYWGETQVGQAQSCVFTVAAAAQNCAPLVSGTVVDSNQATISLTGNENVLVRYMSEALCTIQAQARMGAAITEKTVDGQPVTGNTYTISGIEKDGVIFAAGDSRGYTGEIKVTKTMVPYVRLSCNPAVKRTDPTSGNAVLEISGDGFFGSFGKVENQVQLHYRVGSGAWVEMSYTVQESRYAAKVNLSGLDYTRSHTLQVRVADRLQTLTQTVTVGKGIPVFDWGEGDFAFHVPVTLAGLPQMEQEAVNKTYADKKLSVVKLWENPDPNQEFPAQTVQANLSGCAFIFCTAIARTGGKNYQISSIVPNASGNSGHINSFHADGKDFWLNWRGFTLGYNSIQFDGAWMRDLASGAVYEDWRGRSVPVAVYGLRGEVT